MNGLASLAAICCRYADMLEMAAKRVLGGAGRARFFCQ